jgi:hypothetical protein
MQKPWDIEHQEAVILINAPLFQSPYDIWKCVKIFYLSRTTKTKYLSFYLYSTMIFLTAK